jgi:predicted aspartyl protease
MRILSTVLAALFALSPLAARADAASDLLAKHEAFAGWQAGDGSLSSIVLDGTMTSLTGTAKMYATVHEVRRRLAERETRTLADGSIENAGFTGSVFWATNENGFTHPVVGEAEKFAIAQELLFNEGASALPGTIKGTDTVAGVPCTIVQVKADASDPLSLCIDPQTGAVKRAVIDPGGTYEQTVDILAYADAAPGKKVISQWHFQGSDYTHLMTNIAANQALTDADLHPPAQTASWAFANGQSFPMEFHDNDISRGFFVAASFNGVKGRFLVDTGASQIALNRTFAGRVHMKPLRSTMASGIGGATRAEIGKIDTFQIGGNTLSNVIVSSLSYDLWDGKDQNGNEVDGIIGYDLFGGAIVAINLDSQQMTLFDPASMQLSDSGAIPLTVDLENLVPSIPMTVNGKIGINALLDSGDLAEATFSFELASKYGLNMLVDTSVQGITSGIRFASGVGGVEREECGRVDSISVGPIVYQNAPACKSRSMSGNDAIVGFDFIKNFNIIFDYPQAKMLLLPRPHSN